MKYSVVSEILEPIREARSPRSYVKERPLTDREAKESDLIYAAQRLVEAIGYLVTSEDLSEPLAPGYSKEEHVLFCLNEAAKQF